MHAAPGTCQLSHDSDELITFQYGIIDTHSTTEVGDITSTEVYTSTAASTSDDRTRSATRSSFWDLALDDPKSLANSNFTVTSCSNWSDLEFIRWGDWHVEKIPELSRCEWHARAAIDGVLCQKRRRSMSSFYVGTNNQNILTDVKMKIRRRRSCESARYSCAITSSWEEGVTMRRIWVFNLWIVTVL